MNATEERLLIDGQWVSGGPPVEVTNKYSGEVIAGVASSRREDVDSALAAAAGAAPKMAALPAHKRHEILLRTAQLLQDQREDLARTIALEAGKALKFARAEVDRAISTFTLAGEEARRIHGETISLDAVPSGEGFFGFWRRRPVGVVVAITPFNFPLNLVAHKVAPALAAGNSLVLKPATTTPLSSIKLCRILTEAGLPPGGINLVLGSGATVGEWLVADRRVAKITFTGSVGVGERITSLAGIKKVTLELGNTSPVVVGPDADLDLVAKRCSVGAFYNSGQVCISVQRIYGSREIYEPLTEKLVKETQALVVGDPLDERVDVGPMITEKEAVRVEQWVDEARQGGAQALTGGARQGPVYQPTLLVNVTPGMKVMAEEVFGPVASVVSCANFDEALEAANTGDFALQAAVFTRDLQKALQAIERLDFGGVIFNESPSFRADHMPYGGNRLSGLGREGLRFAIEEMTNIQMVAFRLG